MDENEKIGTYIHRGSKPNKYDIEYINNNISGKEPRCINCKEPSEFLRVDDQWLLWFQCKSCGNVFSKKSFDILGTLPT